MSNVQWDVLTSTCFSFASFSGQFVPNNRPVASTQLSAEWAPSDGKWEDKDFENDIKKLEKEAEERLDAKISEMMANVEKTWEHMMCDVNNYSSYDIFYWEEECIHLPLFLPLNGCRQRRSL